MSAAGWLIIGLVLAVVALALVIVYLARRVMEVEDDFADQQDANHAKCIAHIADFSSKRVVALHLRDLAERYDTVPEQKVLAALRRQWSNDGQSIPAMWLAHQADLLDPPAPTAGVLMIPDEMRFL